MRAFYFVCLVGFLTSSSTTTLCLGTRPRYNLVVDEDIKKPTKQTKQQLGYIADGSHDWRLTILRPATHVTKRGDHDFCLSRSHYTDTDPTSRERVATAEIEPTSSPRGVARSTDWATAPPKV